MAELSQIEELLGPPITHTQSLFVSDEEVWNLISKPGNLVDFHPFCESNPVEIWPGVGSRDVIHYYSGLVLVREFDAWYEGIGYDLTATADMEFRYQVIWRINPGEDQHSSLTITIRQFTDQLPEKKVDQYARLLGVYLQQVGQGLEYFLRTGDRVTRNQFGSHRFFSPPINHQPSE
jgi:hypothetical protein